MTRRVQSWSQRWRATARWAPLWLALAVAALPAPAHAGGPTPTPAATPATVTLTLFHGQDCPHCADERAFLVGLQARYPRLDVAMYEVWYDRENMALLRKTAAEMGFVPSSTPVTIIGDQHWIGFTSATARAIEETVAAALAGEAVEAAESTVIDVPFFGQFDVARSSLLVSAVVIGFLDGINPCSLWVLSMLLAIVLHSGSSGRGALVGTTFLVVTTGMYALYMIGMYSALDYIGEMSRIRLVVGGVALVFGLIHMKDYFWFKQGPSLSIDDSRKPGLFRRMRSLAVNDKSVPALVSGTVVLAVGVSLMETPCTAGLPLLWTNMLASQGVGLAAAIALFAVYMFVFLLDELVVFGAAVATLRVGRVQEQHGRVLKLVSGSVMVTLAIAMMFVPFALESVIGTLQVFAVAAALVAVILALTWVKQRATARRAGGSTG
jgi:cytochrome c biogenesis protein CcdA/glutaredoxin